MPRPWTDTSPGVALALSLVVGFAVGSCSIEGERSSCSESELARTDREARRVWEILASSEPTFDAYCDSSPHPYASGSMEGPADDLVARAQTDLGCTETSVDGYDDPDAALLHCELDDESYLLQIARDEDPFSPGSGLEVGLYQR